MQIAKWSFNPGLAPTLACLLVFPLLLGLGFWQLDRADQKQAILDEYIAKTVLEPVDLNVEILSGHTDENTLWRRGVIRGRYTNDRTFMLDNQVVKGMVGYFVYSPFEIEGSKIRVIINRGWVPAGEHREVVPQIAQTTDLITLTGLVTDYPPPPGILMGDRDQNLQQMAPDISRMQIINGKLLEEMLDYDLFPYVIRLDPSAPAGFVREWSAPESGKEKHLGYAVQWFALAAALVVIYISVNLRRREAK